MKVAARCEALKLVRSLVGIIAAAATVAGVTALCGVVMVLARSGDRALVAKLGSSVTSDWPGLWSAAAQITGAGGFVAFGVVAAWVFSREFTDGTISGLFALPLSRATIALAKTVAFLAWVVVISVLLAGSLLLLGTVLGFGTPGTSSWWALARQVILGVLTGAVVLPVAWVASASRSLLASVGGAIGLLVIAQFGALSGTGGWMPLAAPALWAVSGGRSVSGIQLTLSMLLGLVAVAATVATWRRMQLDR